MATTQDISERAEHVRALNKLNEDVASFLQSAGTAVKHLTNTPPTPDQETSQSPVDARKDAFRKERKQIFTLFTRIRDALAAEADALESAKLIPSNPPPQTAAAREGEQGITNGGLGRFDIGWLNSRGDGVMRGKERELWAAVRQVLGSIERGDAVQSGEVTGDQVAS